MSVLVDTSVWVEFFKGGCLELDMLLNADSVITHPLIIGELACGTPPSRKQTLQDLSNLDYSVSSNQAEELQFIEENQIFGLGCGFIDLSLLASTVLTQECRLWTLDKRLETLASKFQVNYAI
jgi:hypothetical protein